MFSLGLNMLGKRRLECEYVYESILVVATSLLWSCCHRHATSHTGWCSSALVGCGEGSAITIRAAYPTRRPSPVKH